MKKIEILVIVGMIISGSNLYGQLSDGKVFKGFLEKLSITEKQKAEFEKKHDEMEKDAADIKTKIQTARAELDQMLKGNEPRKIFIKSKVNEIARLQAELHMLPIELWFDINDDLTSDQQKIWKKALEAEGVMTRKPAEAQPRKEGDKKKSPARKSEAADQP